MTAFYRVRSFLRWLFRRSDVERALSRDLDDYIERAAAEKVRHGLAPDDAVRTAKIELGGIERTKEEVRTTLTFQPLDTLIRDVRYAFRSFRRHKTFTAVILLCVALGVGANTTVFSFLDSILLRALPVRDPDSIVQLWWSVEAPRPDVPWPGLRTNFIEDRDGRVASTRWSYPALQRFAEQQDVVSAVIGRLPANQLTVDDGDGPLASGTFVTGNYFSGLGVRPLAGRLLNEDDDRFDAPPAIVLDETFSTTRYGSAEAALGATIRLNRVAFTVVGVTPREFFGLDPARSPDFYIPMRSGPLFPTAGDPSGLGAVGNIPEMYQQTDFYWMTLVARLRPGVSFERADAVLGAAFSGHFAAVTQEEALLRNAPVLAVESGRGGFHTLRVEYREPLFVLFAMVVLILAVTCAGIAALQLSRAMSRRPEMAVRLSLGCGRPALIRQLLTESALLALLGGALGLLVSVAGIELLSTLLKLGNEGRPLRAELSWPVLGFTGGVSLLAGVLFGLAPALRATRVDVFQALKGSRSIEVDAATPGRLRIGFGRLLVVAQIALSLVLLIGASLFAATLSNLRTTDLGYDSDGLLFATVNAGRAGYAKDELVAFYQRLRRRLSEEPGVESVSYSWSPLAGGGAFDGRVSVPGITDEPEPINIQIVGERFFETLGIPILRGHAISERDIDDARAVAVVDRRFAETYFPGTDPTGRTIDVVNEGKLTIVGVAGDARQDLIRNDVMPVVYYTYTWDPHNLPASFFELRTRAAPLAFGDRFRRIVGDLDPAVIVTTTTTHRAQFDQSIYQEIAFARLSRAFAALALLVACIALYGTVSDAMARRTPEFGIRMALGASRSQVLTQAFRQVLGLGLAGLALGVPAALVAARYIESFLWGVAPYEPAVLAGAAVAVLVAVALAGFVPARRAALVDPMRALRNE